MTDKLKVGDCVKIIHEFTDEKDTAGRFGQIIQEDNELYSVRLFPTDALDVKIFLFFEVELEKASPIVEILYKDRNEV